MAKIYGSEYGGYCVGRVESDGKVYDREYGGYCVGRVESSGKVYDREYGGYCIGRAESVPTKMGGAALILLLR